MTATRLGEHNNVCTLRQTILFMPSASFSALWRHTSRARFVASFDRYATIRTFFTRTYVAVVAGQPGLMRDRVIVPKLACAPASRFLLERPAILTVVRRHASTTRVDGSLHVHIRLGCVRRKIIWLHESTAC